jgi:hypothetical protein
LYGQKGTVPAVAELLAKLAEGIDFVGSCSSLRI